MSETNTTTTTEQATVETSEATPCVLYAMRAKRRQKSQPTPRSR